MAAFAFQNLIFHISFLYFYWAASWPTLEHYPRDNLAHPILITELLQFWPEGCLEPHNEVGSLSLAEHLVGFDWEPSDSDWNTLTKDHSPQVGALSPTGRINKNFKAEQKLPMQAVYVGWDNSNTVCVVANDTHIYLRLMNISHYIHSDLYFEQWKTKDKDEVSYRDIHVMAVQLENLTLDFTNPFFGCSKIKSFVTNCMQFFSALFMFD